MNNNTEGRTPIEVTAEQFCEVITAICSHGRLSGYLNGKSKQKTFKGYLWIVKK